MKRYDTTELRLPAPTVVCLGCFDGVHKGHAAVIRQARRVALHQKLETAVLTFNEPPKNFFVPGSVSLLSSVDDRLHLIHGMGIEHLVCLPFDESIASLSAEEFFESILIERLNARHLICGFNYTFGAGGKGNVALLQRLCHENMMGSTVLAPVKVGKIQVSSSAIRQAIESGDTKTATALLGRPYSLRAPVVDGQKLARQLGFPTMNQIIPQGLTVPRYGVYAVRVLTEGAEAPLFGIANVGMRPTVGGTLLCVETHLFDSEGDLYGTSPTVEFLSFLRDEVRFDSLDALRTQVESDIEQAKSLVKDRAY